MSLGSLMFAAAPSPDVSALPTNPSSQHECVVVLHGLARGPRSMARLARAIAEAGFRVSSLEYPSTSGSMSDFVTTLEERVTAKASSCSRIHFVGYSLGAIVLRAYLAKAAPAELGRVVMIAPPNHGSQIVDALGRTRLFRRVMGAVASELGTSADSLPN